MEEQPKVWVCAPETDSKKNGDYENISNDGLKSILESILHRIDMYANGESSIEVQKQQLSSEFKVLRNENGWANGQRKGDSTKLKDRKNCARKEYYSSKRLYTWIQ